MTKLQHSLLEQEPFTGSKQIGIKMLAINNFSGFGTVDHAYYLNFSYPNFASTSGLELVSISSVTSNQIYLVNTAQNQSGNVYRSTAIRYDRSFQLSFQFECSGGGGADGFCVQWSSTNNTAGSSGGGCGRLSTEPHALMFTTYTVSVDGITWWKNGVQQGAKQDNAISWRQNVYYWADYNHHAQTMKVYYSTTNSKPTTENHTFTSFVFDTGNYYLGFGAGTGTVTDNHILKAVSLSVRK
jgi:hypothetical protein